MLSSQGEFLLENQELRKDFLSVIGGSNCVGRSSRVEIPPIQSISLRGILALILEAVSPV